jgi:hypothetical protein
MKLRVTPIILAKLAGVCLLILVMAFMVACGSGGSGQIPGTPAPTLTVSFGQFIGSPTSALQPIYCGGWATNATAPYSPNGVINVYGKFTQTDKNENPVGIDGATATATVQWPDGSTDNITVQTTSDGLAVFSIPMKASAINHIVLISITFVKGNMTCTIPQAAYFTAIITTPTATGTVKPTSTGSPTGTNTPSVTPSVSPTVGGSPIASPSPIPTFPFPSPTPTKGH